VLLKFVMTFHAHGLCPLFAHLTSEGKIIHPICGTSVFVVSRHLDRLLLSAATWHEFSDAFPKHTLSITLDSFSRPRTLNDHMKVKRYFICDPLPST